MPYLNLDLDYFTHPKVERLVEELGTEAFYYPIRLWCYAGKHFPQTGILHLCTPKQIEKAIGWSGESGKLVEKLVQFNFMELSGDSYRIHDWKQHAGHLAAFKKRAKSAAKARWKKYATSIPQAHDKQCLSNAKGYAPNLSSPSSSSPNQSVPNQPKEEEKKKRKEISAAPSGERDDVAKVPSAETWESYAFAYQVRYGTQPVRNAKVNGQLSQLVRRLGSEEAPRVAAFYLTHNKALYVSARHATDLLLRDAEGLRTEWATGVKATTGEAKNAERKDDAQAQIARVKAMMAGEA